MTTNNDKAKWSGTSKAIIASVLLVQFITAYFIGTGALLSNDQHSLFAPIAVPIKAAKKKE